MLGYRTITAQATDQLNDTCHKTRENVAVPHSQSKRLRPKASTVDRIEVMTLLQPTLV